MFLVGKIVTTFGNKGDLKVMPLIDPSDYLLEMKEVFVEGESGEKQKFKVLNSKKHKNAIIFSLEGIEDMNVAEAFADFSMFVPSIEIKELENNEFYIHQLEGMKVLTEDGKEIGVVDHLIKGGNDILVIKDAADKEVMVPFVDELVPEVNMEERTIIINPIEGLVWWRNL